MNKKLKPTLNIFLFLFLIIFLIISTSFSQDNKNLSKSLSTNGEIIRYLKTNLYGGLTDEILTIYKNIISKKTSFAIFSLEKAKIQKIFDIELDPTFLFFSIAKIENNLSSILLFTDNSVSSINLSESGYKIEKILNLKKVAFGYHFTNDFPYIQTAYDINGDDIDELFILTTNSIEIYSNKQLMQSYPYQVQAYYNYKSSFGGISSSQNILMIFPDILLEDINNDGYKDLILKYRTKVEYSFFDAGSNQYAKGKNLDLSKYVSVRSGYSFFNEHIKILYFDKDRYPDILIFNFNMASVFNSDKTGILTYLFKGNKDGWTSSPSNQFFIEDLSGLESKIVLNDFNKDGLVDLVNIGSKLFSSNFLLSLSMKRSIPIYLSFYPQINDSFAKSPILQIEKAISLDNQNVLDSSQLSFDFYSTFDLASIISEVIVNYDTDFNSDSIIDYVVYNFDGTFSLFLSNLSNQTIFQKKENANIFVSNEFLTVYYLSGPYTLIVKDDSSFYLVNIIKRQGKIYFTPLKF
ncbi:MAG: hypothetical protein GYA61_08755 [Spirochaetales bacterium]|jgi:hypothetical protein|nr:hypothetical protein [Exilispira sp.]NMC68297.1 hypothetical protein [Spirochaetales bacterium]